MNRQPGRKFAVLFGAAILCCAVAVSAFEIDVTAPEASIRSLQDGLVEVAQSEQDLRERFDALLPLIRATHDLDEIARLTVRRQWREFSEDERRRFSDAFAALSTMTYASRFSGVNEGTFELSSSAPGSGDRTEVATVVHGQERDVPIDYTLQNSAEGWRIINIVADGVSDLALKRAEYQSVLSDGDVDALIGYIEEQTAALQ